MHTMTGHQEALEALTAKEVARIKADFEILYYQVNGVDVVYLDSGATSQKPRCVYEAEQHYYENANAAVHRGAHSLAVEATEIYEGAREKVAEFIGARTNELVWTANATEALNLISYSMSNASLGRGGEAAARFRLGPGDEVPHHRAGAPCEPDPTAGTGLPHRCNLALRADHRRRGTALRPARRIGQRKHQAGCLHPRFQRAGDHHRHPEVR